MDERINKYQTKMEKSLSNLSSEYAAIRAGRANPHILDKVMVDYYGSQMPLKNISNISTPDPRQLMITPFDPKSLKDVEKAINKADIGITPSNDGKNIRLVIPPLTEERRRELTKTVKKMGEESKVAVRNLRRDMNDMLKKQQKNGEISEDELANELDDVQKKIDAAIKDIDKIVAEKEKEIMEV